MAHFLQDHGIQGGDKAVIFSHNHTGLLKGVLRMYHNITVNVKQGL